MYIYGEHIWPYTTRRNIWKYRRESFSLAQKTGECALAKAADLLLLDFRLQCVTFCWNCQSLWVSKFLASNDKGGLVFRSPGLAMVLRGMELPEDVTAVVWGGDSELL